MYIRLLVVMFTDVSSFGLTRNIFTAFHIYRKKFHKTKIILRPVRFTFGGTKPNNRQNETNNLILYIA
jgi:hypothetical protein